jgi:hypothetical protein
MATFNVECVDRNLHVSASPPVLHAKPFFSFWLIISFAGQGMYVKYFRFAGAARSEILLTERHVHVHRPLEQ